MNENEKDKIFEFTPSGQEEPLPAADGSAYTAGNTAEFETPLPPSHNIHNISRRTYTKDDLEDTIENTGEFAAKMLNKSGYESGEFSAIRETPARTQSSRIIIVLLCAVLLLVSIVGGVYLMNSSSNDDFSDLNKDIAIGNIMAESSVSVIYDGRTVNVSDKNTFYSLLRSERWVFMPKAPHFDYSSIKPEILFNIDDGYRLGIYGNSTVCIEKGSRKRYYSIPYGVIGDISGYLSENTSLSLSDTETFLSASDSLLVSMSGLSCYASDRAALIAAMNIPSWTKTGDTGISETNDATLITDNLIGLKVLMYKDENTVVTDFNGNKTYYKADPSVFSATSSAVIRLFDLQAMKIYSQISASEDFYVTLEGVTYRLDTGYVVAGLLDFGNWHLRSGAPTSISGNADIVIKSGETFTLNLYKTSCIAECGTECYAVPSSLFAQLSEYITNDSRDETLTELSQAIGTVSTLNIAIDGSPCVINATSALPSLLALSSWNESGEKSEDEPSIVLFVNDSMTAEFYQREGIASVVTPLGRMTYNIPTDVITALKMYTDSNLYTELWPITATELGALQASSSSIEITLTGADAGTFATNAENFGQTRSLFVSLDLVATDVARDMTSSDRIEVVFKGDRKFSMTFAAAPDGSLIVHVSGMFYSEARRIDRYFVSSMSRYPVLRSNVIAIMQQSADSVAYLLRKGLVECDADAIYEAVGSRDFDYSHLVSLAPDTVTITPLSERGMYEMTVTKLLADGKTVNEDVYIVTVGPDSESKYIVKQMILKKFYYVDTSAPAVKKAEDFLSWTTCEDETFASVDEIKDKKSFAEYLMILASRDGYGSSDADSSKYMRFTQAELNAEANKHFGIFSYDATDTPLYRPEDGTYILTKYASAVENRRCILYTENRETGKYTVVFEWYSDPLCLYPVKNSTFVLRYGADGTYIIESCISTRN